jgi:Tfp pilus assembly protein PilX
VRRLLVDQSGMALPVSVAALGIVMLLAWTMAAGADGINQSSDRDSHSKRALAGAEAGLQAATYRLNKLAPSNGNCLTDVAVSPAGGECPPYSQDLGNDASYTYYVTPALSTSSACAGHTVVLQGNAALTVTQRCITATGEVNGIRRRAQARVAAYQGVPVYPVGGIVGLSSVTVNNSANINGAVGANGQVTLGNSSTVGQVEIDAAAPAPVVGGSSTWGPLVRRTPEQGPLVLAPVDVGTSATENDNARITTGLDASTRVAYVAETRELTIDNNGSLTLGGGTYNFCRITVGNNGRLNIAPGAIVRIFVDSPERAASGCPAGSGTIATGNNAVFNNPSGRAENMQIYVYGSADGQSLLDLGSSSFNHVSIYAPQSSVVFKNHATIVGGLAAAQVEFKNGVSFTWAPALADLRARTVTVYYRTAWRECRSNPTDTGDPESGC